MKKTITLLAIFLSAITAQAQDPNILWQRTIGGSDTDYLLSIEKTNDGGSIIGGSSLSNVSGDKDENSNGGDDLWIIKMDAQGNIEWQNTIGGSDDDNFYFQGKILQTVDGGYIIGATSSSNISGDKTENSQGDRDFWIVKLDSFGNIEWQNTIGGSGADTLLAITPTTDAGYLIGGSSNSGISGDKIENSQGSHDFWILKLNNLGIIIWQNTIGGDGLDLPEDIIQTQDGNYIVAGFSNSGISGDKTEESRGAVDYWIVKVVEGGAIEWQKTFGGSENDLLRKIVQTSDGGYIVSGESDSDISGNKTENSQGLEDYWILKLNSFGNILWQKTIGGSDTDRFPKIIKSQNGGYLVGGESYSNISGDKTENSKGLSDCWLLLLDSTGEIIKQKTIGGDNYDSIKSFYQENTGDIIIGADSYSNISGDKAENSRGDSDYWILKLDGVLNITESPFATAITLYPNPAKNTLQLNTQNQTIDQIIIYTMTGSKILQLDIDTVSPTVDVFSLASGVYYVQIYSGKNVALKKFIKE